MSDEFLADSPELKRMFDAKYSFHTLRSIQRSDPAQMVKLNADFKAIIEGGAVTNTLFQVLKNKDAKLGEAARKDAEAMGFVKSMVGTKTETKSKEETKTKAPAPVKKVQKKPPTRTRKRASPTKEERAAKRKKFENVSLDDLTS